MSAWLYGSSQMQFMCLVQIHLTRLEFICMMLPPKLGQLSQSIRVTNLILPILVPFSTTIRMSFVRTSKSCHFVRFVWSSVSDAYSKGELFSLDMELLKAANSTTKQWNDVETVPWDASSYQPTLALAQNHIHFLGVPGLPAGSAKIFVIHCVLLHHILTHVDD